METSQHAESSFWKTHGGKNTSSSKFESRVTSVEDDEFSKRLKSVDCMKELVLKNRRTTIFEVANILRISFGSVQSIRKTVQTCFELLPNLC